jgi:crossover junction endodeoxyribonuclease RuvC
MSDRKRVVGLDLSLTATGWYIFDARGEGWDGNFGVIDAPKLSGLDRMDSLLSQVQALTDPTTLAVIEDFSFASKGRAVFEIGGFGYLVRHALRKRGVEMLLVAPTLVKKFATGKGNADKSLVLKEVYKRWQADFEDDNVADAYVLARIGMVYLTGDYVTSFQQEVMDKLRAK